jgi:hypothetical protein
MRRERTEKEPKKGAKAMPDLIKKHKGDLEKYCGFYVATKDFGDSRVVSYGDNPVEVRHEAREKGAEDPVIFFVPKKGMASIY